ncbi:TPA: hypothetical protein EYP70_04130 [Candidatus Bathyarchaeota archaeon]|nr:hypothetical protein [Candidatus Bathyarchaeota archaeon]
MDVDEALIKSDGLSLHGLRLYGCQGSQVWRLDKERFNVKKGYLKANIAVNIETSQIKKSNNGLRDNPGGHPRWNGA